MKQTVKYDFINIIVFLLTALWFLHDHKGISCIGENGNIHSMLLLIFSAVLVHTIKAGRLYLALYGTNIEADAYLKIYCKVTPVSMIWPFKAGEIFRMYCYGKQIGDLLKGIIVILLDRFMDTAALITIIVFMYIFDDGNITVFICLLLIFLVFILLIYFVFPGVYSFWKMYLLKAKASEGRLRALKMLEILYRIYSEIENIAKGCGIILYFMSFAAWGVEIGSVTILNGILSGGRLNEEILLYLTSAVTGQQKAETLNGFVFVSTIGFLSLYLMLKMRETFVRGKNE